eukprot:GEZU01024185.1.p1 GENE.GEZU01024185.1~~GEZU01024185.1.p1  ORF type:complete len:612 (-),score=57.50 GEZU01024185.1:43-1878(-)
MLHQILVFFFTLSLSSLLLLFLLATSLVVFAILSYKSICELIRFVQKSRKFGTSNGSSRIETSGAGVKVNCWFCNEDTRVRRAEQNSWWCPRCYQYNGFTEDGDYNKVIDRMHAMPGDHVEPSSPISPTHNTPTPIENTKNLLCHACNTNQTMIVNALAAFEPVHEESFDEELEQFHQRLERIYPLCSNCRANVDQELARIQHKVSIKHLATRAMTSKQAAVTKNLDNNMPNGRRRVQQWKTIGRSVNQLLIFCLLTTFTANLLLRYTNISHDLDDMTEAHVAAATSVELGFSLSVATFLLSMLICICSIVLWFSPAAVLYSVLLFLIQVVLANNREPVSEVVFSSPAMETAYHVMRWLNDTVDAPLFLLASAFLSFLILKCSHEAITGERYNRVGGYNGQYKPNQNPTSRPSATTLKVSPPRQPRNTMRQANAANQSRRGASGYSSSIMKPEVPQPTTTTPRHSSTNYGIGEFTADGREQKPQQPPKSVPQRPKSLYDFDMDDLFETSQDAPYSCDKDGGDDYNDEDDDDDDVVYLGTRYNPDLANRTAPTSQAPPAATTTQGFAGLAGGLPPISIPARKSLSMFRPIGNAAWEASSTHSHPSTPTTTSA